MSNPNQDPNYNLKSLLDSLYKDLDSKVAKETNQILVPDFEVSYVNRRTHVTNMEAIALALHRTYNELQQFFEDAFSMKGKISKSGDNDVVVIAGMFGKKQIELCIERYIKIHVQCGSCKSINTYIAKIDRITYIICNVCKEKNAFNGNK